MRIPIMLRGRVASVLLWGGTAAADRGSPEHGCEKAKLCAIGAYQHCLIRAYQRSGLSGEELQEDATARCDDRFDRAFERAETEGACRTYGGCLPHFMWLAGDPRHPGKRLGPAAHSLDQRGQIV